MTCEPSDLPEDGSTRKDSEESFHARGHNARWRGSPNLHGAATGRITGSQEAAAGWWNAIPCCRNVVIADTHETMSLAPDSDNGGDR